MKNKSGKKRKRFAFLLAGIVFLVLAGGYPRQILMEKPTAAQQLIEAADLLIFGEPAEVRELRKREVVQEEEGYREYYFQQLDEQGKRCYREMLEGIRERKEQFYLSVSDDELVDRSYHAVLKDHPELFWIHNREQVYKTTYSRGDYCLFEPGYTYTQEESAEILSSMEAGYQEVLALIPQEADDYEKVKTVYTYLIDTASYVPSEHDQSIAGTFWKKEAVCAGYAGAVQYLLERLGIFCIYVEGDTAGSDEGHAWNIVELDGQYYYVDATNGDQPDFLEGEAALLEEHKTTIYDYLCPFPEEYEKTYTASAEFTVPACTATDKNFYVLNNGCFDAYNWSEIYDYCRMRLDNGAAVVRFKFSNQEAFEAAYGEWIEGSAIQDVAQYYMQLYGLESVQYHYGVIENLKTIYYMF